MKTSLDVNNCAHTVLDVFILRATFVQSNRTLNELENADINDSQQHGISSKR